MLTLTRKVGESILIGEDIQIVVKEIHKSHVKLSIHAPRETSIHRAEVTAKLQQETSKEPPGSRRF